MGVPKAEGYALVSTQELRADEQDGGSSAKTNLSARDAEQSGASNSKAKAPLSVHQLILRRGLSLFVVVLLLAIGIAFHLAFPVPESTILPWSNITLSNNYTSTPLSLWDVTLTPPTQR